MNIKNVLPILGVAFLLVPACNGGPEGATFDQAKLHGRWELSEAWRNGKKTETLTGTFYEFSEQGQMRTNLTPTATEEEFSFSFDGSKITQKGGTETLYKVEDLTDTSLVLTMTINNFPFRLKMGRAAEATGSENGGTILQ